MTARSDDPTQNEPDAAHAIALSEQVRGALFFQSYEKGPDIDGVWTRPLRKHHAENGWFMELFRLEGGRPAALPGGNSDWEARQLSLSYATPNRLNAFHLHPRVAQNEIWMVVQGVLVVWLVDCRKNSATEGVRRRFVLNGSEPVQLFIPAGVAHGYRAGPEGAILLYAMDQQFDPAHPNEGRLPWDHFGADLWQEDRG